MPPSAPDGAPNVTYVIIDDIGFSWIEPFGGLIRTPNIERLVDNPSSTSTNVTTKPSSPTP